MHLVSHSLKKLTKLGLTTSTKAGKEVVYRATKAGVQHPEAFLEDRARYVEPAMRDLIASGMDLAPLTKAFSGAIGSL